MSVSSPRSAENKHAAPKAPDVFVCKKCNTNQAVFIDRERNLRSGFASVFVSYLFCARCDRKFWKTGPAIIIPCAYLSGLFFLIMIRMIRM